MKARHVIFTAALCLTLCRNASSAQSNDAITQALAAIDKHNYSEAVKLFSLTANQGYALAQTNLGVMYYKGEGMPENYIEAYKWLSLSAASGDAHSIHAKDILRPLMTADQIAEAQRLAAAWRPSIGTAIPMVWRAPSPAQP